MKKSIFQFKQKFITSTKTKAKDNALQHNIKP